MLTYQSPSKLAIAAARGKRKGNGPKAKMAEDEDLVVDDGKGRQRYHYIETNSNKAGIWDAQDGRVIALFLTKEEALDELARLRAGSSQVGVYNYGSRRLRTPDLQEVHY
jgi:hypothetical protein